MLLVVMVIVRIAEAGVRRNVVCVLLGVVDGLVVGPWWTTMVFHASFVVESTLTKRPDAPRETKEWTEDHNQDDDKGDQFKDQVRIRVAHTEVNVELG